MTGTTAGTTTPKSMLDKDDIWKALAAPLPTGTIEWRQDGRPVSRDGRHIARFVAYIEANTVRERLDSIVPGEWDFTLEPLPTVTSLDEDANQGAFNFKGRLQILGVIREDVGTGKDYKQAATDTFKRAAVRFGIGHELYAYEQNWVQMDGEGKYAKPVEDPGVAYARRYGKPKAAPKVVKLADSEQTRAATEDGLDMEPVRTTRTEEALANVPKPEGSAAPHALDEQSCPKCGGRMWDNRITKRNPKAPDFKCRDRGCDGVIWPPKGEKTPSGAKPGRESADGPYHDDGEEPLPF